MSPEVTRLVLAVIGGSKYRQQNSGVIERDLLAVSPLELCRTLSAAHLGGLFFEVFGQLVRSTVLLRMLQATAMCQRLYTRTLVTQLESIRVSLMALGVAPIILKGPALWGWLYPNFFARKTRDLDLVVGEHALRPVVQLFRSLGYDGDYAQIEVSISANAHYELPALTRDIVLDVSSEEDESLRQVLSLDPLRQDFQLLSARRYRMMLEIEFHKSIFLFTNGTLAPIPDKLVVDHAHLPGFRRLTLAAQLSYLSTKFGMDITGTDDTPPQAQSLKLMADVVRLMEVATAEDIEESVMTAKLWGCESYYGRAAASAGQLLPEIDFRVDPSLAYDLDSAIALADS